MSRWRCKLRIFMERLASLILDISTGSNMALSMQFDEDPNHVNTFIDDLLGAIVAATCAKVAHKYA